MSNKRWERLVANEESTTVYLNQWALKGDQWQTVTKMNESKNKIKYLHVKYQILAQSSNAMHDWVIQRIFPARFREGKRGGSNNPLVVVVVNK